ncbi:MAG: hypothetical protein U0263_11540 [Polyangiaceae bacterium]
MLIFHHIPKTAGTSFVDLLRQNYSEAELLCPYDESAGGAEREWYEVLLREHPRLRCVAAHSSSGKNVAGTRVAEAATGVRQARVRTPPTRGDRAPSGRARQPAHALRRRRAGLRVAAARVMKLRALVMTAAGIERYLAWLGEPSDPPRLAPARAPPYFKHPAIRMRLGEPVQAELFDAH